MANTRTLIKSGSGNVTAALVANTQTNVAVVTLPADANYEYEVFISLSLKNASAAISYATVLIGGNSFGLATATTQATFPLGAHGLVAAAGSSVFETTSASTSNTAGTDMRDITKMICGPSMSVTVGIQSTTADTYYINYHYIGRKTVTESF